MKANHWQPAFRPEVGMSFHLLESVAKGARGNGILNHQQNGWEGPIAKNSKDSAPPGSTDRNRNCIR
jgi:hypothetical protein